jgi:outer membrane protein assembly factor BamD
MKKFITIIALLILVSSCNEYQKALKSDDVALKYAAGIKKYEKKKYLKALRLFEVIAPAYKGKPQAENLFYVMSQSYYNTEQFYSAGYQFDSFASSYPKSEKAEEACFLAAKSYSKLSPRYSLDQVDTEKAIDKAQNFIDRYPNSKYLADANVIVKELRNKIEKKVFENAKQYNTISDYKSSLIALDNFIADYPGTPYKEDALFYKLSASYNLAINSIPQKLEERLRAAKITYNNLISFKTDSKYKSKANEMLAKIDKDLQQFSK